MKRVLLTKGNSVISTLFQDKKLLSCRIYPKENSLLNQIGIARVKNIVPNIQAAFLDFGGTMCYYSLAQNPLPVFAKKTNGTKICLGDEILVQIKKEAVKTKEPVAQSDCSIQGKYVVLSYGKEGIAVSSKIRETEEKQRLKTLFCNEETLGSVQILIRTNAALAPDSDILNEYRRLKEEMEQILKTAPFRTNGNVLWKPLPEYLSEIRDASASDFEKTEIVTDSLSLYEELKEQFPEAVSQIRLYTEDYSLDALFSVSTQIDKLCQKNVWLKSGGYLVIEPTETLTAIDINTGKAIAGKKKPTEEFLFQLNLEAAAEVMNQIRLRNLSGMILVDFINMKEEAHITALMKQLSELAVHDPVKTKVVDMTKLGLVEITRQKVRRPLLDEWKRVEK